MKLIQSTVSMGKRLIGLGVCAREDLRYAFESGTLVIVAGTTNGYVAEEVLKVLGPGLEFDKAAFFRGVNLPPGRKTTGSGRLPDESRFPGDLVIVKGEWQRGKTIFDVADGLGEGDMVVKGANALDLDARRAAILVGHPEGGTALPAVRAWMGRRTRLLIPVGLEKRVPGPLDALAARMNEPGATGLRYFPLPGEVFTELDALMLLCGVEARIVASGGVFGAEGSLWLSVSGKPEDEEAAKVLMESLQGEVPFGE